MNKKVNGCRVAPVPLYYNIFVEGIFSCLRLKTGERLRSHEKRSLQNSTQVLLKVDYSDKLWYVNVNFFKET